MYKRYLSVPLFVLFVCLVGCSHDPQVKNAWFTEPGQVLEYNVLGEEGLESKCAITYTLAKFKGVKCIKATRKDTAMPFDIILYYSCDKGNLNWLGMDTSAPEAPAGFPSSLPNERVFRPAISLLSPEPVVDNSIKGSTVAYAGDIAVEIYSVDARVECLESVIVPAGSFECLKLVLEMREVRGSQALTTMTLWLSKGTGIVKSTIVGSEIKETLELSSVR